MAGADWLKRVLDVAASGVGLVITAPIMAGTAVVVLAGFGRPVLFRQPRPGRNAEVFELVKFRTMVAPDEYRQTDAERLTPVGRFLRSTSLDELPTLWNVLRGEMSLVGPRPITLAELPRYGQVRWHYLSVRPGMTGLWQVSGRNDTTYDERVELDREFVEQHSLRLRLSILLRTLRVVIRGSGAR